MLPIGPSEPPPLGHDPEKWEPVFGKIMLNKELELDDDPKKNHPALGRWIKHSDEPNCVGGMNWRDGLT